MASFFKNLFRKEGDSQPVPAAPLTNEFPERGQLPVFPAMAADNRSGGLPQGTSGPFAGVSSRQMTVRELAALLPAGLLRFDGVSPDQVVALPLDELRQSLLSGRPSLRLSRIQEACPGLFQRPLAMGEDAEVTFPVARVKGLLESAPVAFQAAVVPPGNPFASIPAAVAASGASPFGPRAGAAPLPGNPFAPVMDNKTSGLPRSLPVPPAAQMRSPQMPSGTPAGSPFAVAGPVGGSPFAPAAAKSSPLPSPFAAVHAVSPVAPVAFPSRVAPSPGALPSIVAAAPAAPVASPFAQVKAAAPVTGTAQVPSPFAVVSSGPVPVSAPPVVAVVAPVVAPVAPMNPSPFGVVSAFSPPAAEMPQGPVARTQASFPAPAGPMNANPTPSFEPPLQPREMAPVPASARVAPVGQAALPSPFQSVPAPVAAVAPATQPFPVADFAPPAPKMAPPVVTAPLPVHPEPVACAPVAEPAPLVIPAIPETPPPALPAVPAVPAVSVQESALAAGFLFSDEAEEEETMSLSLRAVLRDADPVKLGFAPEKVPETVQVTFPVSLISPQLAMGKVVVGIAAICEGIPAKFRPAFSRAAAGLEVNIPMSEVFHNLPESARPALIPLPPENSHQAITTSPFQTPFVIRAEDEPGKQLLDLSVTGFDKANVRQARPSTQPVGPVELPPAPLPLVVSLPEGAPPAATVELPSLRPIAAASASPDASLPVLPRSGMLSRPPGSGTGPQPPLVPGMRTPSPVKAMPPAPAALRAFPKPAGAPPAIPPLAGPVPTAPQIPPVGFPVAAQAAGTSGSSLLPPLPVGLKNPAGPPPVPGAALSLPLPLPAVPPASMPGTDGPDDLGESFSAARLSTEPPPRAGSAPVALPAFPGMGTPPPISSLNSGLPPLVLPVLPAVSPPAVPPASISQAVAAIPEPPEAELPVFPPKVVPQSIAPAPVWPPSTDFMPDADLPVAALAPAAPEAPAVPEPVVTHSMAPAVPDPVPVLVSVPLPDPVSEDPVAPLTMAALPAPVAATAPIPAEDLSFGCLPDLRQLTLRAIFATDRVLTTQDIVDACAGLPGLKACALFHQDTALISQGMAAAEAAAFQDSALKTRESLAALADSMGLGSGGNFTLRTDHGVRSFFLESGLCLAVWHAQPAFSGGIREKLILTAQELAKL